MMIALLALVLSLGIVAASWIIINNDVNNYEAELSYDDEKDEKNEKNEEEEIDEMAIKMKEREKKEEVLREELGSFFVPLPPLEQPDNPHVKARGLYLTGYTAGRDSRIEHFINLLNSTELNSLVIDVKDDHGIVTYSSDIEFVEEINADRVAPISDLSELVDELHENGIYTIARVVIFKDPYLPEKRPEWAIQRQDRKGVWEDNKGVAWVNPYNKNVWDYNLAVAKEAALMGFREIQFDYVRFPENARFIKDEVYYPDSDGIEKDVIIAEFLDYARSRLEDYNVHISADTFGVIATSWGDADQIGQTWEKVAPLVDYHCPMIYPSHYGYGYFGYDVPDANPEGTVARALKDSLKRNAPIKEPGIIRPWLQAFTAPWIRGNISYGPIEIRKQIEAAYRLGIDEYLLWNAGNNYPEEAFITEEQTEEMLSKLEQERINKGLDYLGHSVKDAAVNFLDAVKNNQWREAYIYHSTGFTKDHHDYKEWKEKWSSRLVDFEVISYNSNKDKGQVKLNISIKYNDEEYYLENQVWDLFKENHLWRIVPSEEFLDNLLKA